MTSAGRIELAGGVITGSLGAVTIPLSMLFDAIRAIRFREDRGADPLGLAVGAALILLFFIMPSLLTAYGSYLHAAHGEARGRAMVSAGSLFLTVTFGICAFTAGYGAAYLIWLRLLLVIASLLTWIAASRGASRAARIEPKVPVADSQ